MGFESRHRDGSPSRETLIEALARAYGLELERVREVLRRAEQLAAEDPQGRSVRQWFARLVEGGARVAVEESTRHERTLDGRGPARLAPGRETLVMRELAGASSTLRVVAHTPGRQTRVMLEGQGANDAHQAPEPRESSIDVPRREPERLEVLQQWRMSQAFGFDFSGVSIQRDSPAATGSTRAVVKDGEIHFREGAYQPGTRAGDWLIAHELAHVVQQQGGRGGLPASHKAIEREADRAASLVVRGQPAPIALRAQAAVAYAFSDAEDHAEVSVDDGAATTASAGDGGVAGGDAEAIEERAQSERGPAEIDASAANTAAHEEKDGEDDDGAAPESVRVAPPTVAESAAPEAAAPEAHEGNERHAHAEGVAADAAEATAIDVDAANAHEALTSAHDPVAPEIVAPGRAPGGLRGAEAGAEGASGDVGVGAETKGVDSAAGDEEEVADREEGTYDPRADLAMPPVAGEGGGGGGVPGGGGGAPPKPQKEAPSVVAAPPEAGFTQLRGVRPDKLVPALGQIHGAAKTDVDGKRVEAKANPPKQMSNGDGAAAKDAKGAKGADAGAPGAGKKAVSGSMAKVEKAVKGEVPGGEAAKQAQQGQAQQQQKNASAAITATAQQNASWLRAFSGKPAGSASGGGAGGNGGNGSGSGGGGQPAMTDAEKKRMSDSLVSIPTSASGISTDPGPAPALAMQGKAKATSDQARAKLEQQATQLQSQGQADSRVSLGEDHIETSVVPEELTARSVAGGTVPKVAMPSVAGAVPSEEVAIVAQEQHGVQIDAALTKASADVAVERAKHAQEDQKARAEADKQIRDLKIKADADQAAARTAAKAESDKVRGEWRAEIDKKGADARKQADKKVAEGMGQVEAEEAKANDEARRHIEEGKQKADDEKQKGEREAEHAKQQGKEKSSGFFGWLSSKAKAFFDGIKRAISAAIDACRKAVKAVIDAAKKLAMAAIELARKAIVAVIKAIGEALIAITDVLLAGFPELKAKFQAAIRAAVNKAVAAVNKLAEGLKKAVQAALDFLGKALDAALSLLEKGLHAIVDLAAGVVQGAIDAAKAIVDTLGQWVKIIKDVAKGPGAWIGKLGAAVVDGIKNHLWTAFKTAVLDWFKSKVIEVLGVAGMILQVLMDGGITMDDIVKMALDALIVAIPAALVAILIEKLVAMIVPAAGALMAIIEGLQAAWGTISRIIAAFAAFMAFLSAVQSGSAGPLFATALAAAAVVLLDFVANWLLKKLRGPAAKVGKRLEGMAGKLKRKGKGKGKGKPGSKPKQKGHEADGPGAGAPKGKAKKQHDKDADRGKTKNNPDRGQKNQKKDKDQKKTDKDQKKQDKQDKKDKALVERVARQAASTGWRHAKAESGSRVQSHAQVESIVRRAAHGPAGVRVDVDVVGAGSSWRVKAKANKGSHTATSSTGNGTTLKAKAGSSWYTSKNLRSLHQQILRDTARELKQPGPSKGKDLHAVYDAKKALAQQLEAKGQAKIDSRIHGIKFDITMEPFAGVKDDRQIKTKLLISPNYEELELNVPATGDDTFKELVKRLQAEVMSKNPYHNQDVILADCDKIATALGAKWTTVAKGGGGGKTLIVKFTANDTTGKERTYVCQIVQTKADDRCASCGKAKGEIGPHNVVSQRLWQQSVNDTLATLGLPVTPVSPLQIHITSFLQGRSAAFGDAQKQCPHCETPGSVAKTGKSHPRDGADFSLIQRGKLPNTGTDPSIVGKQFGGTSAKPADLEAITAAHVTKVVSGLSRELANVAKMYASDPVADICDKKRGIFVTTLKTTVRVLAR